MASRALAPALGVTLVLGAFGAQAQIPSWELPSGQFLKAAGRMGNLAEKDKAKKAWQELETLVEITRGWPADLFHYEDGELRRLEGKLDSARDYVRRQVERDAGARRNEVSNLLGILDRLSPECRRGGENDCGLARFRTAAEADTLGATITYNLGWALLEAGLYHEAREVLESIRPDEVPAGLVSSFAGAVCFARLAPGAISSERADVAPEKKEGESPELLHTAAGRVHETGAITVRMLIDEVGVTRCVYPIRRLEWVTEEALGVFRAWRFEPVKIEGNPASVAHVVSVTSYVREPYPSIP